MVLVDTSVLIDFFKGISNPPVMKFNNILIKNIPFGITEIIYQEVLQGAKTDKEFADLKLYLSTQKFYSVLHGKESFERAAGIYYRCRRKGITIKSTIDVLIAEIALENNLFILHNDEDYKNMGKVVKELKFY